jgi:hypothetical protein
MQLSPLCEKIVLELIIFNMFSFGYFASTRLALGSAETSAFTLPALV